MPEPEGIDRYARQILDSMRVTVEGLRAAVEGIQSRMDVINRTLFLFIERDEADYKTRLARQQELDAAHARETTEERGYRQRRDREMRLLEFAIVILIVGVAFLIGRQF